MRYGRNDEKLTDKPSIIRSIDVFSVSLSLNLVNRSKYRIHPNNKTTIDAKITSVFIKELDFISTRFRFTFFAFDVTKIKLSSSRDSSRSNSIPSPFISEE